jgi:hypothetical protein
VRAKLEALTKKAPQVVVKLYGGGKGMKEVRQHLRYIARADKDGQVALEDETTARTMGGEDIGTLAEDWKTFRGIRIPETSPRREALNIVFSMPEGTDPIAVKKAVRDFAAREFAGHHYAIALHTEDTPHYAGDQQDPPTPNPHVHVIVLKSDERGRRLNPRKADLQRWREGFAQALGEHGVDAVATSRMHRLKRERGWRQKFRQMNDRGAREGKQTVRKPSSVTDEERVRRAARAREAEKDVLRRYAEVTQLLAESEDPTDRALAGAIAERFGLERPEPPAPGRGGPDRGGRPEPPLGQGRGAARGRTGTDDLER